MAWNSMPSYTPKEPSRGSMRKTTFKARGMHYADRAPKANVVYANRPGKAIAFGASNTNGQKNGYLSIGGSLNAKSRRAHKI